MKRIIIVLSVVLCACQKAPEPSPAAVDKGRPETRNIEAADAMGYNGKQVRQKVDGALDANDEHNKQLEQMTNND